MNHRSRYLFEKTLACLLLITGIMMLGVSITLFTGLSIPFFSALSSHLIAPFSSDIGMGIQCLIFALGLIGAAILLFQQ